MKSLNAPFHTRRNFISSGRQTLLLCYCSMLLFENEIALFFISFIEYASLSYFLSRLTQIACNLFTNGLNKDLIHVRSEQHC